MTIRQLEQKFQQRMAGGQPIHAWVIAHEGRVRSKAPHTRKVWAERVEHCRRLVNRRAA